MSYLPNRRYESIFVRWVVLILVSLSWLNFPARASATDGSEMTFPKAMMDMGRLSYQIVSYQNYCGSDAASVQCGGVCTVNCTMWFSEANLIAEFKVPHQAGYSQAQTVRYDLTIKPWVPPE